MVVQQQQKQQKKKDGQPWLEDELDTNHNHFLLSSHLNQLMQQQIGLAALLTIAFDEEEEEEEAATTMKTTQTMLRMVVFQSLLLPHVHSLKFLYNDNSRKEEEVVEECKIPD